MFAPVKFILSLLVVAVSVSAFSPAPLNPKFASTTELGPIKRGGQCRIKRKESYWYNKVGQVAAADKPGSSRYPITVRFDSVNYAGVNTNNFCYEEVEEVEKAEEKPKK